MKKLEIPFVICDFILYKLIFSSLNICKKSIKEPEILGSSIKKEVL